MYRPTYAVSAVGGRNRRLAAQTLTELCLGLCRVNLLWLLAYPNTPRLRDSKIVYKDDSRVVCSRDGQCHFVEDEWADVRRVHDLGYGDCEDLACIVVAEEWLEGRKAWPLPRCYGCDPTLFCPNCKGPLRHRTSGDLWHIQVLTETGRIIDPSRDRGMRPHPDGDDRVVSPFDQAGIILL